MEFLLSALLTQRQYFLLEKSKYHLYHHFLCNSYTKVEPWIHFTLWKNIKDLILPGLAGNITYESGSYLVYGQWFGIFQILRLYLVIWIDPSQYLKSLGWVDFIRFFFKKNFFYFQFSASQFTWQIWQTNNSIESNKSNRIMNKA